MWLQLDGAPAHFALSVRQYLNEVFPRWFGRSGTVAWPPRSPDLTPCDYHLWGWLKQKVYFVEVNTREELRERIRIAADELRSDPALLRRATRQIACLQNRGEHFEQLIN
uniref:SFRICE_041649 n=1 Tax=Spodoptera frugiperda TaxID=7108 RepID=A0A2H1WKC1_SPOFR